MRKRNFVHVIGALVIALLLAFPTGGQAATARAVPILTQIQTTADDFTPTPVLTPPAKTATPSIVDRGLEALGGYRALEQLQAAARERQAAAAVKPAATPAAPPHTMTVIPQQPRFVPKGQTPAQVTAAAAPAKDPQAGIHIAPELLYPAQPGDQVGAEGSFNSPYYLNLSQEVFSLGQSTNVTARVTYNGARVAGATVRIGDGGPTYTTGDLGEVTFPFTAPTTQATIRVYVSTATLPETFLGEMFSVNPGNGVLVINQVDDQNGQPVDNFEAMLYHPGGTEGRSTGNGRMSVILPAGTVNAEIRSNSGTPGLYFYQSAELQAMGMATLHPSASASVHVRFQLTVDSTERSAEVYLRNELLQTHDTMGRALPQDAYVTPGTYSVVMRSLESPESVVLARQNIALTSDDYIGFATTRTQLDGLRYVFNDSRGVPATLSSMYVRTSRVEFSVPSDVTLLVEPYVPFRLSHYHWVAQGPDAVWFYQFFARQRSDDSFYGTGQSATVYLGGPVQARTDLGGCQKGGCNVDVYPRLLTAAGDELQAHVSGSNGSTDVNGDLYLRDQNGNTRDTRHINTNSWMESFTLPTDAQGAWSVLLHYPNLGPYNGDQLYEQVWPISVQHEPAYNASISPWMVEPDVPTQVTVQVTADSQPASGLQVAVGWNGQDGGTYTTGSDGVAAFTFVGHGRQAIPIYLGTPSGWQLITWLYSVPQGYGVLYLDAVDQSGRPVSSYDATISYFYPGGGWSISGTGGSGGVGLVQPVGTNYVEMAAHAADGTYFFYGEAPVTERNMTGMTLSGANTVPVSVTASIDGAALNPEVRLHNQRMNGFSMTWDAPLPANLRVTPGTYTVLAETNDGNPLLLMRQNVDLTAPTNVNFAESSGSLAELNLPVTPSPNPDVTVSQVQVMLPDFEYYLHSQVTRVTPGIPYQLERYDVNLSDAQGQPWQYWFDSGRTVTPAPGEQANLAVAGPLHVDLHPEGDSVNGGNRVYFSMPLRNPEGDLVRMRANGDVQGNVTLQDAAGNVLINRWFNPWDWNQPVEMPTVPGTYTLTATYETGPYQGAVSSSYTFAVESPVRLDLSSQTVASFTPADVTVTATRDGAPVAGLTIALNNGLSQTTDGAGQATFHFTEYGSRVIRVDALSSVGARLMRVNLFVLNSGDAAIQIGGFAVNGQPLTAYEASSEISNQYTTSRWSDWVDSGVAGTIVPAGRAFVQLSKSWSDAYLMSTQIDVAAGSLTTVLFDGAQTTPLNVTATLDGAPLPGSSFALHNVFKYTAGSGSMSLDGSGQGVFHVTPGTYLGLLYGNSNGVDIAAKLGTINTAAGTLQFDVQRSQLERLEFVNTYQGQSLTHTRVVLDDGSFDISTGGAMLASPGHYGITWFGTGVGNWFYDMTPKGNLAIELVLGKPWLLNTELNVTETALKAPRFTYQPGDELQFTQEVTVGGNWIVRYAYNYSTTMPIGVRILDANSNVVYTSAWASPWQNRWTTPKESPSTSYTVEVSRDLGPLGQKVSTATYTLVTPKLLSLRLDTEMLTVGQYNQVHAIVTANGRPAAYAWIQITGETAQYRQTDSRGVAEFNVKPTRAGNWAFSYNDGPSIASATAYALAPGYGLLDVDATDRNGQPLPHYYVKAFAPGAFAQGYHLPEGQVRKLVVPAGPVQIVVRGRTADWENYYLTGTATVPSMGSVRAAVSGAVAAPISVSVANAAPESYTILWLRNTAMAYDEQNALITSVNTGSTVYATPGNYEVVAHVQEPGTLRVLPLPGYLTVSAGPNTLELDAAVATTDLAISAQGAQGQPGSDVYLYLKHGSIMYYVEPESTRILVWGGNYQIAGGDFNLTDAAQNRTYRYNFRGSYLANLCTPGSFILGGPLTASVAVSPATATTNGKYTVKGQVQTFNTGLTLVRTFSWDNLTGQSGWVGNTVEVTGPNGYMSRTDYPGGDLTLTAPATPGTYQVKFTGNLGAYGPSLEATTALQVLRLSIFRP